MPGLESRPAPSAVRDETTERDYSPLVRSVGLAALVLILTKAASSVIFANWWGGRVEIRLRWSVLPHLAIFNNRQGFVDVVTWSTVVGVAASIIAVAGAYVFVRRRDRDRSMRLDGWAAGLVMAVLTLGLEWRRHLLDPPAFIPRWAAISLAALVLATAVHLIVRPRREPPEPSIDDQQPPSSATFQQFSQESRSNQP